MTAVKQIEDTICKYDGPRQMGRPGIQVLRRREFGFEFGYRIHSAQAANDFR
jgi:hypothetical protein